MRKPGGPTRLLDAVEPPVGVLPRFCRDTQTTIILQEKVFNVSGDSFIVCDTGGGQILRCAAKGMSLRAKKDMAGTPMFQMRTKLVTLLRKKVVEDPQGNELFRIDQKLGIKTKMHTTFKDAATGKDTTLALKGDIFRFNAEIMLGDEEGPVVGTISREYWDDGGLAQEQADGESHIVAVALEPILTVQYYVTVAPGMDLALMAVFCIAFDELKHERHGSSGGGGGQ